MGNDINIVLTGEVLKKNKEERKRKTQSKHSPHITIDLNFHFCFLTKNYTH